VAHFLMVLDRNGANLTRKKTGLDFFNGWRHRWRMKFSTWNVNGIRAALNKGLKEYLLGTDAAVVCLQETKAEAEQVDLSFLEGWQAVWSSAEKKGYSGTCVLSRVPLLGQAVGIGAAEHDREGRVITVTLADFHVVNVYTPNAQADLKRLPYRLQWDEAFRGYLKRLEASKPVLVCGDLNCAHEEIDLANPKANRNNPGFSDAERASFSAHLAAGWVDVFREFDRSPGRYTWWTMRTGGSAREKNIGWRLDYWLASAALRPRLKGCQIRTDVYGSDHCPVELLM
jgi:exodeoxyribonuclease-3